MEAHQICVKCNQDKPISMFRIRDDKPIPRKKCKDCEREEARIRNKQNYITNREKILNDCKKYYQSNKEKVKARTTRYYENHKEEMKEKRKEYVKKHRSVYNEQARQRYKTDEVFRLKVRIRNMIKDSFTRRKHQKNKTTCELLGCDIPFFIKYLKNTYRKNYNEEWDISIPVDIDHIIPLDTATTKEEVEKLCHYTNLQLLKASDNRKKHNKLNWKLGEING